jgi:D-lyxose ketol-isomerase
MKRSKINELVRNAVDFFDEHRFFLPPFARWTPDDWSRKGEECREIVARQLGWDVTEFGRGRFDELGLLLFTLRNGSPIDLKVGKGKLYAEKIMIVGVEQVTPMHYHWSKTEDIINRGGGRLLIELHRADDDGGLADGDVTYNADGVRYTVPAGHAVSLHPGESITLTPEIYHTFWAEGERVLAGEVSTVNDDATDNRFQDPLDRFPSIEEDEPPLHLLVTDYATHYRG